MWIRSAYWVGRPHQGHEDAFATAINDELVPAIVQLPGVVDAKALWPRRLEDSPPDIACQILVNFGSKVDIDRMLASPERRKLRTKVIEIIGIFNGKVSHIDFELG